MVVLGVICLLIAAIIVIPWLFRKIAIARKYKKTTGEIVDFRNMVPLVDKKGIVNGGKYVCSECNYRGNVYVTVRFFSRNGEEMTRRYNSSEPVILKINEHERSVPQYTAVFPDWRIGARVKVFYAPDNTMDISVGKAPPLIKTEKKDG